MVQNRFLSVYAGRAYSASPDLLAIDLREGREEKGLSQPAKNTVAATVMHC